MGIKALFEKPQKGRVELMGPAAEKFMDEFRPSPETLEKIRQLEEHHALAMLELRNFAVD